MCRSPKSLSACSPWQSALPSDSHLNSEPSIPESAAEPEVSPQLTLKSLQALSQPHHNAHNHNKAQRLYILVACSWMGGPVPPHSCKGIWGLSSPTAFAGRIGSSPCLNPPPLFPSRTMIDRRCNGEQISGGDFCSLCFFSIKIFIINNIKKPSKLTFPKYMHY